MRYVVLLFFALVMLNKPTIAVAGDGPTVTGDQAAGCCGPATSESPAEPAISADAWLSAPYVEHIVPVAMISEKMLRVFDTERCASNLSNYLSTLSTTAISPTFSEAPEAVPRRLF